MDNTNLTQSEIRNLINLYKSELKKLQFQFNKTHSTVEELRSMLELTEVNMDLLEDIELDYTAISRAVGSDGIIQKKDKKRKRRRSKGGYKLSDWDIFLLETIQNSEVPLINQELFVEAKKSFPDLDEAEIKGKISRSIHKLANKRKVLKKHRYEGRGFAYTVLPTVKW